MEIFNPIFEAIGWLLALFYSVIPNFGVSIILLTFTIMLLLYPLTAKQAKSMIAMQRAQPEIKKLQAKYKGDKQKLNEETMKFYQENKINPLAGCLPLLVQMPIFFALFRVLRDPIEYVPKDSELYASLCRGFGKFCGADLTQGIQAKLGGTKIPGIAIGEQLINHQKFLGMDLQLSAVDAHSSIFSAAPYFLLVGLVMLTGFLQTRQAQKRTPVANKQMGMVMRVLPVFFGLISLQFPAGLVLYFFVSNLWRLGQQEVIFRKFGSALTPTKGGKALPGGKQTAVIDVESKETAPDDADDGPPVPIPPKAAAAKPKPKPSAGSSGAASGPATSPRRGLRAMFELPPPPESNGGGTPGPRAGGGAPQAKPKPPPAQKRSNKKKRKR